MFEFKLQICSLVIVMYIAVAYIISCYQDKRRKGNIYYKAMLVIAPISIIFDGATAWTVNHLDSVSPVLNLALHGLFFSSMDVNLVFLFIYMVNQTIKIKSKKHLIGLLTPGIISVLLVIAFLPELHYNHGVTTNYSMGISVVISYAALMLHFLFILCILMVKHSTIEKRRVLGLAMLMLVIFVLVFMQCLLPEILISALLPVVAILGIYISFENPAIERLHRYNNDVMTGFAALVENRDNNTGGHIKRTQVYVGYILDEMKYDRKYHRILTKDYYNNVYSAAPLHDLGKISIPDAILTKPGKLSDDEYEIMKTHTVKGGDIILSTFSDLDDTEYLHIAYDVARHHHEKWDGTGYPDGLKGEEIPLHARIMAIADVFDATSSDRCYRDAMPVDDCFEIIKAGSGTAFDPNLVDKFLKARPEIEKMLWQKNIE